MSAPRGRTAALTGALLLVLSAVVPQGHRDDLEGIPGVEARAAMEPLAAALSPLGPAKSLVSSALWVQLLRSRLTDDVDQLVLVSEGLLAVHPGLERVREHLAAQLVITRAPRAVDDERHDALVQRGLAMLEDGIALDGSPRLHGALGRLVATQTRHDSRFASAARRFFGHDPLAVAIEELRLAGDATDSSVVLADLLVDRGLTAWVRDGDVPGADRDLREAEALAMGLPGPDAADVALRIAEIRRQMHDTDGQP
jgi:hypothetical protein